MIKWGVLAFGMVMVSASCVSQTLLRAVELGFGGKLCGGVPFLIGNVRYELVGAEVGLGARFFPIDAQDALLLWYNVLGKFYLFLSPDFIRPYFGGGVLGVTAQTTYVYQGQPLLVSVSALGFHGLGGLEVALGQFRIFFGADWIAISELRICALGTCVSRAYTYRGLNYHGGVRYDF